MTSVYIKKTRKGYWVEFNTVFSGEPEFYRTISNSLLKRIKRFLEEE